MSHAAERTTKGERTRQRIVERASVVFNTHGIAGASMADISEATGLEKGGVYNHFATKEALAVAAFEYGASIVLDRLSAAMAAQATPLGKLRAVAGYYRDSNRSTIRGGCPIMNTAIEADGTNPALRKLAQQKFDRWREPVAAAFAAAIDAGEIASVDPHAAATVFLASIEGAVMLSMLYGNRDALVTISDHLDNYLDTLCAAAAGRRT